MNEYEAPLVGAMLADQHLAPAVIAIVQPSQFADNYLRDVYAAIVSQVANDKPADVVTIADVSGKPFADLIELASASYSRNPDVISGWAKAIVKDSKSRALRSRINELWENSPGMAHDHLIREIATLALSAEQEADEQDRKTLSEIVDKSIQDFDDRYHNVVSSVGLSTGVKDLDEIMRGYCPGDYVIIAGRPGSGKSVLALQGLWEAAIKAKEPSVAFSLEMPAEELVDRFMVQNSHLTSDEYANPNKNIEPSKIETLAYPITELKNSDCLDIFDDIFSVDGIVAKTKELYRKHGRIGLVVVDYLQLMTGREELGRVNEIGAYSRTLRLLALSLQCAVIAVSQLSRKCEERTDKRPLLSDLRESGSLEQDGTKIVMVYRDEMYNDAPEVRGIGELLLRKHRGGKPGHVVVSAQMNHYRFRDMAKPDQWSDEP